MCSYVFSCMYRLLIILLLAERTVQELGFCEYMRLIKRTSPECFDQESEMSQTTTSLSLEYEENNQRTTTKSTLARIIAIIEERESTMTPKPRSMWMLCESREYKDCHVDVDACESGYSCRFLNSDERCCVSSTARIKLPRNEVECPAPYEMGYTCTYGSGRVPISWCRVNDDCSGSLVRLCCDTGCGFKVCHSTKTPLIDPDIRLIENENCPPASVLDKNCRMNSSRVRNWCNSDDECQMEYSYKVGRWCCPTACGYNTCVSSNGFDVFYG